MSVERLVIIGGGIAAVSAAAAARQQNPDCEIIVVSEESYLPYTRTKLSLYFHQDLSPADLQIHRKEWYESHHIDLRLGTKVSHIDVKNQVVTTANEEIHYDALILATGASSFVPPIPGTDLPEVIRLRTLDDAQKIKATLRDNLRIVVIGGGILGLEAAWSLHQANAQVAVVEMAPRLMPNQTDLEGSNLLQNAVEQHGVSLYLGQAIKSIQQDGNELLAELDSGKTIAADLVIFSAGIRPRTELAKDAGIDIDRGIVVNPYMETSAPNIWACGDCAAVNGNVYGLWNTARQQGTVAGVNAVQGSAKQEFKIEAPKTVFSAFGINLFSAGLIANEKADGIVAVDFPGTHPTKPVKAEITPYRRLFLKDGQVVGGLLINTPELAGEVTRLVESKATLQLEKS